MIIGLLIAILAVFIIILFRIIIIKDKDIDKLLVDVERLRSQVNYFRTIAKDLKLQVEFYEKKRKVKQ